MGLIIGKFRKKKTTLEVLEKLENEIKAIEEFRRDTELTQKKMVGRFIFVSICVYALTALFFYYYSFPATVYERILCITPLILLPVLLAFMKQILTWYYNRKLRKNQSKLSSLKEDKKRILEEVMEKETYKVAKKILEKFAPEQIRKNSSFVNESTPVRGASNSLIPAPQTGLRYRGAVQPQRQLFNNSMTPIPVRPLMPPPTPGLPRISSQSVVPTAGRPNIPGTPLPLPRGILPRERSVLDKMVDYLVGDGPSNRYALICKNCSSHNGMALREEFDYLSFNCCYCLMFNPARKKRPAAPKLDVTLSIKGKFSGTSESEKSSGSGSESEPEPIVTEPQEETPVSDGQKADSKARSSEALPLAPVSDAQEADSKAHSSETLPMEVDTSTSEEKDGENIENITATNSSTIISEEITAKD